MHYVYVLKSKNYLKSYVGHTDDLGRRLSEHNDGRSNYTKKYKPWVLIYSEQFNILEKAIEREKFFKTSTGRRKLKVIFQQYLPGRLTVGQ